MFKNIHQLAELFNKIQDGIATEEEKSIYKIGIGTSCLDETILVKQIKQKASELKEQSKWRYQILLRQNIMVNFEIK